MFFNLIYIELIRLFKNRSIKFCIPVGIFMLVCCVGIAAFGMDRMVAVRIVYDADKYGMEVLTSMILAFYEVGAFATTVITAVFTTCDYSKYRLAINIEGVERNRFKLCLSEIIGILIFVASVCLAGVPVSIVGSVFSGSGSILGLEGFEELLEGYISIATTFFIISSIACVTAYFVSKLTKSKAASFIIVGLATIVFLAILVTSVGFIKGFNEATNSSTNIEALVTTVITVLSLLPGILCGIIFAIKSRRSDRI